MILSFFIMFWNFVVKFVWNSEIHTRFKMKGLRFYKRPQVLITPPIAQWKHSIILTALFLYSLFTKTFLLNLNLIRYYKHTKIYDIILIYENTYTHRRTYQWGLWGLKPHEFEFGNTIQMLKPHDRGRSQHGQGAKEGNCPSPDFSAPPQWVLPRSRP